MNSIIHALDWVRHLLAENLASGSFSKRVLKKIYWCLPRILRESNITPYAIAAVASRANKKFIQIGANDGVSHDPLYPYLIESKWHGLMLEPNLLVMEKLRKNHSNTHSELTFINAAIASDKTSDKTSKLYLTEFNSGFASFNKEHVLKHIGEANAKQVISMDVKLITFAQLLRDFPEFKQCDLLLIDTEGWDAKILLSIDFSVFDVDLIIFERVHLTEDELITLNALFESYDFSCFDCQFDRLAISKHSKNKQLLNVLHNADKL